MKFIYFTFFLFLCTNLHSQIVDRFSFENSDLLEVISTLEKRYNVKFSFNSDKVKSKKISIQGEFNLEEILKKIELQTTLSFESINERYYAIKESLKKNNFEICGVVIDGFSEKPLSGATLIQLSNQRIIETDQQGNFKSKFEKENDTLKINFIGYKSKIIPINSLVSQECVNILLDMDNMQLGEVLITEYINSGISKDDNHSTVIINQKKVGVLPKLVEPDVLQTLQFIPGIQSPTETASGLHIRGGTPDHNLILWDGIRMYNTGHFFDILSVFNPYITESVKLQRSNTEAKYGNRISGVIDITSKNEIPEDISMGVGFNLTNVDFVIEMPFSKKFGIVASARRSYNDYLETVTFKNYSQRAFQRIQFFQDSEIINTQNVAADNAFSFSDFTIKGILELNKNEKITFSNIYTNNNLDYDFNILDIQNFYDQNQADNLIFTNQGLSMKWEKKWSPKFSHDIKTYFSNYNFDYSGTRETILNNGSLFFRNNIKENNEIQDFGVSVHTHWKLSKKHDFLFGYNFSTNDVSYTADYSANEFSFEESANNITHSPYAQYRLNFSPKHRINIGLRGNYFSIVDKLYTEPRISFDSKLSKRIKTSISAERKHQAISQVSNYLPSDFNIDNQVWLLSDSRFTSVLKSDQFAAGINFNDKSWYIDLEGYYKDIDGLSSFANGFNGTLELAQGTSKVFGVDLLIKKHFKNYRTWMSYSYTDQNFKFAEINDGKPFKGNFDITHYLSWVHTYSWKKLDFSIGWNIRTGRPYTPAVGITETVTDDAIFGSVDYGEVNSKRLETFHRLDCSLSYTFNITQDKKSNGRLSISFVNLYDRNNILNRVYDLANNNNPDEPFLLQESNTFSAGFTPNASFRINF